MPGALRLTLILMGASRTSLNILRAIRGFLLWISAAALSCSATSSSAFAQSPESPASSLPAQPSSSVAGTIADQTGAPVPGARVKLTSETASGAQEALSNEDGQFSFTEIPAGPFHLAVSSPGLAPQTISGTLAAGESLVIPPITLVVSSASIEIRVSPVEEAERELREQEKQRVLGVVPNFYVTYVRDAAPLTSHQKFQLAWKSTLDPVTVGVTAATAGLEQAQNTFRDYGQGAQGYAKRFGAAYADTAIGTFLGGAVLPSLLKQDPRYFYRGTGSRRGRVLYALANAVICKGDNGRWQPNYSLALGVFAAGGISNLYYPARDRGARLTFENAGISLAATAGVNVLQEFVIRKLTPARGSSANP